MYYVNEKQIEDRLQFILEVASVLEKLPAAWTGGDPLQAFAQERALHLAIEIVTDVGSMLIDGFILRDASSYEDIVDILAGEQVFPAETAASLISLVKLRKPLVQDYTGFPRAELHPAVREMPSVLLQFADDVRTFMRKELRS